MDEKTIFLLDLYKRDKEKDFQLIHNHFERISNVIIEITNKLSEQKTVLKEYEDYYEVHYFKFVLQGLSIQHLFNGTPLRYLKPNAVYHDISSIYTLSRALLESFLTINYLYYNFKSEEQAIFRYLLYSASGLNQRQSYPANTAEHNSKKEDEKKEISSYIDRIKCNSYFLSLHIEKQKYLLARLLSYEIGKEEIFIECGLDKETYHTMWRLLSNYSHSELIEAIQVKLYIKNQKAAKETLYTTFRFCLMLNSYLLIKLTERFDLAKQIYNDSDSTTKYATEFWKTILMGNK